MSIYITYGIIFLILLTLELAYFRIADKCNIIDKPNERSSHSTIVLRGGRHSWSSTNIESDCRYWAKRSRNMCRV